MNLCWTIDRFDIDDYCVVDEQIKSIIGFEGGSLIGDRHSELSANFKSAFSQLPVQTFFVCGFQEARTEVAVNFDCRTNDCGRHLLKLSVGDPRHD